MSKLWRGKVPLGRILAAGGAVLALAAGAPMLLSSAPAVAAAAAPIDGEIAAFYRARGGAPLWFAPGSRAAAPQLIQLLASAQADHLNPRRCNVRALERAVADQQLFLEYQPIVALADGRTRGVEALLRWSHLVGVVLNAHQVEAAHVGQLRQLDRLLRPLGIGAGKDAELQLVPVVGHRRASVRVVPPRP